MPAAATMSDRPGSNIREAPDVDDWNMAKPKKENDRPGSAANIGGPETIIVYYFKAAGVDASGSNTDRSPQTAKSASFEPLDKRAASHFG